MNEIEKALRSLYEDSFDSEEELTKYLDNTTFTINFGLFPTIEVSDGAIIRVLKRGMKIQTTHNGTINSMVKI